MKNAKNPSDTSISNSVQTEPTTDCEVELHKKLTLVDYDGLSVWQCEDCGQIISEEEIYLDAREDVLDSLLDFIKSNKRPSCADEKFLEIVELGKAGFAERLKFN